MYNSITLNISKGIFIKAVLKTTINATINNLPVSSHWESQSSNGWSNVRTFWPDHTWSAIPSAGGCWTWRAQSLWWPWLLRASQMVAGRADLRSSGGSGWGCICGVSVELKISHYRQTTKIKEKSQKSKHNILQTSEPEWTRLKTLIA